MRYRPNSFLQTEQKTEKGLFGGGRMGSMLGNIAKKVIGNSVIGKVASLIFKKK